MNLEVFYAVYSTIILCFVFCIWSTVNWVNIFIKLVLLVGVISGVVINYQIFFTK